MEKKSAVRAAASLVDSDEFRMYYCKILPCRKRYSHDWSDCMFAHVGEKVQRRCPRKNNYMGFMCPDMKQNGQCPRGSACCFAHNSFEYWLHPSRYRTEVCTFGASCKRPVCFFAHTAAELRPPTEVLGPPGHYVKAMYEIGDAVVPGSAPFSAPEQDVMGAELSSSKLQPAEHTWRRSMDNTTPSSFKYPQHAPKHTSQPSKDPFPRMQLPPAILMPTTSPAKYHTMEPQQYPLDNPLPMPHQPATYQAPSAAYQLPQAYSHPPSSSFEANHPTLSDLMVPQYSSTQVSQYSSTQVPQYSTLPSQPSDPLMSGGQLASHHMPGDVVAGGAGHHMPGAMMMNGGADHHMNMPSAATMNGGAGYRMPTAMLQGMQAAQPAAAYSMLDTTVDYGLMQGVQGMGADMLQAVPAQQWMQWQ